MVEKHITISAAGGTWVVRAQGAVIAESSNALKLYEGSADPVIYFPREDIGMIFLEDSDQTSHCPHKGDATYFHIEGKSGRIENAGWSYVTPKEEVSRIAGHIAFYEDKATVEQL
ncbi:uncharacterized protein (DUF427 family) [Rubricella aquisinus]|uniref:Uncharacterized protein (DUF427 family) n=1 Tax=Rubricella aquisinus TaxID=2028108 RepID=A0A840X2I0_9RHOB|nr:DUF427 domain-containing protein [Rubricella aquisinus]MBB5516075.1 uncharacterized protein (DUF427 family) [Rubricella aquisinus]